jgi:hypothetical protein
MSQSRKSFLHHLSKKGFHEYQPDGDIFKYINRDFLKCHPFAVGISSKGTSINVAVYHLETKLTKHFETYSEALRFLNVLSNEKENPPIIDEKPRRRRKKKHL